jgi:hypothetical protein
MNRRDIELLSAYLDGELKPSELAKMEARLNSDPELESEMRGMRATRALLRKLPSRKAPRNFTLTRKMVGQNPPLPRTYPIFRWATIAATLLFFFTIGINSFSTQMASQNIAFGIGGSGGGGGDGNSFAESAPAMEAPAEEPAAPEPYADSLDQATELAPTDEGMRIVETPSLKTQEAEIIPGEEQVQTAQEVQKPISVTWQITLVGIALVGLLFMYLMRYVSARHWK